MQRYRKLKNECGSKKNVLWTKTASRKTRLKIRRNAWNTITACGG